MDNNNTNDEQNKVQEKAEETVENTYQRPNETMTQTTEEIAKEIKKEKKGGVLKEIISLAIVIIIVLLIKQFVVTPVQINGDSMLPTLDDGDVMILNKISYKISGIKRFDMVVIDNNDTLLIKRVIGLPGETISVKDNKLFVNGKEVEQKFLSKDEITDDFETVVTDDCYFVLGDNRDISLDSRELGCFNINEIQGTTSLTIYPFNRFGTK